MEATMNFLEFRELGVGETFIIIHTGDRNEREKLEAQKEVHRKTSKSDSLHEANAICITGEDASEEYRVASKTPVIRIII